MDRINDMLDPPLTNRQIHSLSRQDLAAAIGNALTVPAEHCRRLLLHQLRVSLEAQRKEQLIAPGGTW